MLPTFADSPAASRGAPPPASPDDIAREWRARASAAKPRPMAGGAVRSIADGLAALYAKKVLPAEEAYQYGAFSDSPALSDADFHAKPLVLLLGQYSCGKTTFITHLLGRSFPLAVIGPEPTTDRFCVVHYGVDERSIPGHTLSTQAALPFAGLARFGTGFLNKLVGSALPAELLESVTLVDTPGVLSGEKQRLERNYDFAAVTRWFAERADQILLLFDPHKLDISDELKHVMHALRGHDDKVRVVLNKADSVSPQQLMRVYGALLWALSRVVRTPEVPRVYVGNFPAPGLDVASGSGNAALLEAERDDLLNDLRDIPRAAMGRRVNEFVKRVVRFCVLAIAACLRADRYASAACRAAALPAHGPPPRAHAAPHGPRAQAGEAAGHARRCLPRRRRALRPRARRLSAPGALQAAAVALQDRHRLPAAGAQDAAPLGRGVAARRARAARSVRQPLRRVTHV
jgi:GTPase SAR1 family protein